MIRRIVEGMKHDRRIVLFAVLASLPAMSVALGFVWLGPYSGRVQWTVTVLLVGSWAGFTYALRERVVRPLQTLANMLAALREGDFSIRARGAGTQDSLALAYLEVNALEEVLREQRIGAVEATALLRKVLEQVDLAVFAFDEDEELRIVNGAGERLLGQPADRLIGKGAGELRLRDTLYGVAPRTVEIDFLGGSGRWDLRRTVVRQEGQRLRLIVMADLSRALREEERQAWKRIIRVLSHEINNSLAPIKSIAGSLQKLTTRNALPPEVDGDVKSGLNVIATRAEALGRFMAAYATLARLPEPVIESVQVSEFVQRIVAIETRMEIQLAGGPELTIPADVDQLEQLLINLVRNAVDATLEGGGQVRVAWEVQSNMVHVVVEDEGPGLPGDTSNLFVPFYTTKPGGSGIGLALSRQIAEGHGGTLTLENRNETAGARAKLSLPIDPAAPVRDETT
jgi:nitrogen fixation/metabolism regulation signal transduction histidine kinase